MNSPKQYPSGLFGPSVSGAVATLQEGTVSGVVGGLSCFCRAEALPLDVGRVSVVSVSPDPLVVSGGSPSPSKGHQRTTLNLKSP